VPKKPKQSLSQAVPAVNIYNSFDIVGDIAITKLPDSSPATAQAVAQAILNRHKNLKTVLAQSSAVQGEYRLRKLDCIGGENKTRTQHKESGCFFAVDLESCYFSPRLLGERLRIANLVQPNETVVNMFSGVGCFSILIAKRQPTAKVYSIDVNPIAVQFMEENVRLNRVYGKVIPILGDAKTIMAGALQGCADRILMPLPEKALEYLPCAVSALKAGKGWIHFHSFEHAKEEDPKETARQKIAEKLAAFGINFEVPFSRVVRKVGPNWHQVVADIHLKGTGKF
jgi:tRNA (guanine37-N1)-methyltransferase